VVFNDAGNDIDFRVEGDTNANLLFIDASTDRVGIGTSSPTEVLTVSKAESANTFPFHIQNTQNWGWGVGLKLRQVLANGGGATDSAAIVSDWESDNNSTLEFYTATSSSLTEKVRITSQGRVGIGSTNFGGKLTVKTSSSNGAPIAWNDGQFVVTTGDGTTAPGVGISTNTSDNSVSISALTPGTGWNNLHLRAAQTIFYKSDAASNEVGRWDASGRLLVGTSSANSDFVNASSGYNGAFQVARNVYDGVAQFHQWSSNSALNSEGGNQIFISRCKSGTVGTHTGGALASGDGIGRIVFNASDGTSFRSAAFITAEIDGGVSTGDVPGRLVFSTTADGASSPTERMRITQTGHLKCSNSGVFRNTSGAHHEIRQSVGGDNALFIDHTASSGGLGGISINYTAQAPNNTGNLFIYCSDTSATRFELRSNGGIANFSGFNENLSDVNVKKDISPAADTWDCIKEWEIVNYRYKDQPDDADLNLGVIAQQVAESCPEVITVFQEAKEATEDKPAQEKRLGVKEQQMYWMAIKALQEAQIRIEQLEAKVAALEAQ